MRPSIRSELPSQRFPAALGKLKTDRIALFGSFFRRAPRPSRRIHARLLADNPLRHRGRKRGRVNARSRTKNIPQTANTHAPTRKLFQPEGYEIISQRLSVAAFFVKPEKTHVFLSAAPLGQNSCAPLRRGQKPSFGQPVPGSFSAAEPEFFSHSAQIPSKNRRCRIIRYPEFSSVSASRKGLYEYGASVTFLHFTQYMW